MNFRRRTLLAGLITSASAVALGVSFGAYAGPARRLREFATPTGALLPPNAFGVRVAPGFTARRLIECGSSLAGANTPWHEAPDGACCVPRAGGGWSYVSNCELEAPDGGVRALDFDAAGEPVAIRVLLEGAARPCAGGLDARGNWLACEEVPLGQVWEVDPTGARAPRMLPALGTFNHEAAALDPRTGIVYLTEDASDGALYRFVPEHAGDLERGRLEVMCGTHAAPRWDAVPDASAARRPTRKQLRDAIRFDGGEGAWFANDELSFTTKGDHRLWSYSPVTNALRVLYDGRSAEPDVLRGVDNVIRDTQGLHYVAEDGGDMQICVVDDAGRASVLAQLVDVRGSEITGLAFAPAGDRLYFSSQRNPGATYEIRGDFSRLNGPR